MLYMCVGRGHAPAANVGLPLHPPSSTTPNLALPLGELSPQVTERAATLYVVVSEKRPSPIGRGKWEWPSAFGAGGILYAAPLIRQPFGLPPSPEGEGFGAGELGRCIRFGTFRRSSSVSPDGEPPSPRGKALVRWNLAGAEVKFTWATWACPRPTKGTSLFQNY